MMILMLTLRGAAQHVKSVQWRLLLLCLASVVCSSCNSGPPPRLYLLEAAPMVAAAQSKDASTLTALGISQVKVPGYADDPRIASLDNDGVVVQMDAQRWAEDPEAAITRYLADRLRLQANATVLVEPWPRDYRPQARIEIDFARLLREPDGGASMSGQILLLSGDGRELLRAVSFDHRVTGRSDEAAEYFKAVAAGVNEVVRLAVESLLNYGLKS